MTGRKILIVEDEPIVQLHLQRIVSETGNSVSDTVATARQAIESADREPPELVLMDIDLPGELDGIDAARVLRDRHDCVVVFASAYADEATVARTADIEAAGYITKPFSNADVRAAISTAISSRERLDRAEERQRSLASILVTLGEGLVMTDAKGLVTFANPEACRLLGREVQDVTGCQLDEVLRFATAADGDAIRAGRLRALSGAGEQSFARIEILGKGDCEHLVDVSIRSPIGDRRVPGMLIELQDRAASRRLVEPPLPSGVVPGAGRRILVYSHDTFGLGHLQRSLNLIRALLAHDPECSVLLVTGSPVVHLYKLPKGADYVKLPAVRKVGSERYEARSLFMSDASVRTLRSNLLLRTVRDFEPDALIVDHAPLGMGGEMLPTLEWLRSRGRCTTLFGMRDIIDEPRTVVELWQRKGIYHVLRGFYDHVLVYGDPSIYDAVKSYEFPPDIAAKTHYMHYVCDSRGNGEIGLADEPERRPLIAVSIGGGDGGSEEVIGTAIDMLRRYPAEAAFRTEIVTGPLLSADLQHELRERARGLPIEFREFVASTTPLFARADLVVSTAGYNTATQLLAHGRRAVMIPRVLHRHEQLIRARRLDELGLVTCLHPRKVTPRLLLDAISNSLRNSEQPLRAARARGVVPLDGAERVARFCGEILGSKASVGGVL